MTATVPRKTGDAAGMPPRPSAQSAPAVLALADISVDAGTQVRAVIDDGVVAEYAERLSDGAVFPPVTVYRDGSALYLADGFHRHRAHQRAGRTEIEADVHEGTREDALWFAIGANRAHGHRLTAADKKHAIELAFKAWPDRSQRRIAAQIGCSPGYINKIKGQVFTSEHLPERTVGTDGKSYPARRKASAPPTERAAAGSDSAAPLDGPGLPEPARGPVGADSLDSVAAPSARPSDGAAPPASEGTARHSMDRIPSKTPSQRAQDRSNRIVSVVVADAQNLTTQRDFIDFAALDRELLPEWIAGLESARRDLGGLIRRLREELGDENGPSAARLEDRQSPS